MNSILSIIKRLLIGLLRIPLFFIWVVVFVLGVVTIVPIYWVMTGKGIFYSYVEKMCFFIE